MQQRLILLIALLALSACSSTPDKTVSVNGLNISEAKADSAAAIYAELGLRYSQQGKYKLAMQKLHKAIELDPELPSTYLYMGQLYNRLEEYPDAETYYRKAIELDQNYSRAHNNYGTFLCQQERYPESEVQFLAALKNPLYENKASTLENMGMCSLRGGQPAKAEDYFKQALAKTPTRPTSLHGLAQIDYDRGNYKEAALNMDRYQQVAAQTPSTLWLGIQIARKLGKQDAEASLVLLLKNRFPNSAQAKNLKAPGGKA